MSEQPRGKSFKVWVRLDGRWFVGDLPGRAFMWRESGGHAGQYKRVRATLILDEPEEAGAPVRPARLKGATA